MGKKVDLQGIKNLLGECQVISGSSERDEADWMAKLRLARQRLMLWVAFRDLNGLADLNEVTHALSHFAELAVSASIAFVRENLKIVLDCLGVTRPNLRCLSWWLVWANWVDLN